MMRLNYKRFGTTVTSSAWETGADAANNLSYVYATFTQKAASNTYNKSGSAYYNISCDGKSTGNVSYKFAKGSTVTYSATLGPYYHNADGSLGNKTVTIVVHGDVNNGNHTQNVTVSFTKFARGFSSIPTLTLTSRNSSMFSFDWRTSEAASDVYYDLYNSAGTLLRSERIGGNGASVGSFQLSGLSSNTTYKVRVRAVRQDSGLSDNGTSATGSYTTYIQPTLTLSLVSRTETSLKIKATPNTAVASKSWTLNLNNVTVKTSTSTAETVEFTGLSANKTYQIVVYYISTAANGSLPSESAVQNYSTLQYPYVSAVGTSALQIGNSQTLTLYNPLSRNVTVYMKKDNTSAPDANTFYSGTTTGTSITFTPNTTKMYNSIQSSTSGNCVYYCVYNDGTTSHNVGTKSGTYTTKGTELPTFSTSNWSYTANLTELTNNNQVVIPSYSTVTFRLDTVASGNNSASISSYSVNWGGEVALGGTTVGTTKAITGKTGTSLSMIAIDSRNYRTTATKELQTNTTYIPYTSPTVTSISTHRTDGIQAETTLDINGKFYATNFGGSTGSYTNTLYSVQYYTKPSTSSTWSGPYNIPISNFTINTTNGTFSIDDFQIHANGTSGGFTVGTRYDIKVEIKDAKGLLGMVTTTSSITDGKIARDVYQDSNGEYHEGINGRADSNYTQKINGTLNVTGNETVGGNETITGALSVAKTSTNYNGGAIPGTKQANATTVGGLLDEVRMTNGQMGSVTINTAYTSNNITIATGWYNYLYIPHRKGGSSGSADGDNCNYGNLILVGMTSDTPVYLVRKASNTTQVSRLSKNLVKASVSSKAHTNYNNNQDYLPTMNFLTYWNGAYNSSNSSNLTYCANGTIHGTNSLGACCVNNTTDWTITNTANWQEQKVNLPNTVKNTNTGLFTPTSGGIKVLKAGSYLISGTVNYECMDNCSLIIYQNSTMKVTVDQPSSTASMRNISLPVYLLQCNANDVIYLYVRRYGKASTFVRGMRSYLTVTKIA